MKQQPAWEKKPAQPKTRTLPPELKELETRFREAMGVKATLTGSEKKGKIVLQYSSREELELLYEQLNRLSE